MTSPFDGIPVYRSPHVPPNTAFVINTQSLVNYRPVLTEPDPNRWRRLLHFLLGWQPPRRKVEPKPFTDMVNSMAHAWLYDRAKPGEQILRGIGDLA